MQPNFQQDGNIPVYNTQPINMEYTQPVYQPEPIMYGQVKKIQVNPQTHFSESPQLLPQHSPVVQNSPIIQPQPFQNQQNIVVKKTVVKNTSKRAKNKKKNTKEYKDGLKKVNWGIVLIIVGLTIGQIIPFVGFSFYIGIILLIWGIIQMN